MQLTKVGHVLLVLGYENGLGKPNYESRGNR